MVLFRDLEIARIVWGKNLNHDLEGVIYRMLKVPTRNRAESVLRLIECPELKMALDYIETCMAMNYNVITYKPGINPNTLKLRIFESNSILSYEDFSVLAYPIIAIALETLHQNYKRSINFVNIDEMKFVRTYY